MRASSCSATASTTQVRIPASSATGTPRLDVLIDVSGESDIELGRELAHYGHGRAYVIRDHRDVAPSLMDAFGR